MYSYDADGNKIEWDGSRWTPCYVELNEFLTHKVLNNRVIALYVNLNKTHEDFNQECVESESMLPDIPGVCSDCGHFLPQSPGIRHDSTTWIGDY